MGSTLVQLTSILTSRLISYKNSLFGANPFPPGKTSRNLRIEKPSLNDRNLGAEKRGPTIPAVKGVKLEADGTPHFDVSESGAETTLSAWARNHQTSCCGELPLSALPPLPNPVKPGRVVIKQFALFRQRTVLNNQLQCLNPLF